MEFKNIDLTFHGNTAMITISREKQLNALNKETLQELSDALDQLRQNKKVRGIVLTGAGEKAFVAGADIKEFASFNQKQALQLAFEGQENVFNKIADFPKPIITAINGFALGGGLELALASHIRIASSHAKLGLPELTLGLIPGYGGTQRLSQIVGKSKAIELICTASIIPAEEALELKLISKITEKENLLTSAIEIIEKMVPQAALAISATLKAIQNSDTEKGYSIETKEFGKLFGTDDFKEGVKAFLEKRKAVFKGS